MTARNLTITDAEAQTLHRALLRYEFELEMAALKNNEVVAPELHRTLQLQERISLTSFYPENETETENV